MKRESGAYHRKELGRLSDGRDSARDHGCRRRRDFSRLAQEVKEGVLKNGGNPLKRWKARLIAQLEEAQPSELYSICIAQAMKDNDDLKFIIKELQNMKMVDKRIQELLCNI